jgi:hypothetical protein
MKRQKRGIGMEQLSGKTALVRPWFKQFRRLLLPASPKHLRPFPAIE